MPLFRIMNDRTKELIEIEDTTIQDALRKIRWIKGKSYALRYNEGIYHYREASPNAKLLDDEIRINCG